MTIQEMANATGSQIQRRIRQLEREWMPACSSESTLRHYERDLAVLRLAASLANCGGPVESILRRKAGSGTVSATTHTTP